MAFTLAVAAPGLHAQNLLPNPGFETGADSPEGWRLSDGRKGEWTDQAARGKRALLVRGEGSGSSSWRTSDLTLASEGLYRLRFMARQTRDTSGGCAVSGTGLVNRDYHFGDTWQAYGFVFSVPSGVSNDFVRLGHWETRGTLIFDDVELLPVRAVHGALGEGESIRDGVYRFQPSLGWAGANFHRPLWRNRATFNSDRWVFSAGSEVVYRFAMPGGVEQVSARARVQVNYHVAGALRVEASRDGRSWTPVAAYDARNRGGQAALPGSLFPAREIFLRFAVPGAEGNLQVNTFDYEAKLAERGPDIEGATRFYEVLETSPSVAVMPQLGREGDSPTELSIAISNRGPSRVSLRAFIEAAGTVGKPVATTLEPGASGSLQPAWLAAEPGRHDLTLKVEAASGTKLFEARTEATVGFLDDPRPGHWLAGEGQTQIWWCESGWKLNARPLPAHRTGPAARRPITVAAARGEFEPAQVFLCGFGSRSLKSAELGPLLNERGQRAEVSAAFHEIARVRVTHPTDDACARGDYPDPLPPLALPRKLTDADAMWITFHISPETTSGDYQGEALLTVDDITCKLPVALRVYDFALPKDTHLRSALGLGTHEINRYHKLSRAEDKQSVYEKYLQNFADHRISPYSFFEYSPIDIRFVGEGSNKQARVDFTRFNQAAARWLDEGRFNSFLLPLRGMGGGTFHSRSLGSLEGFKEGTPEFARLFNDYLGQVERHLRGRGWLDKAYAYWFDEPDPKDYAFVVDGMKRIRAAAPGLRRMLTEQPEKDLMGHVEIWCGLTPEWSREAVAARRAAGEEVWWYICCAPKAPYVTEFIDHPGAELRLWPWQSWQFGVQGILVWATTYWTSSSAFPDRLQDPWQDPMSYVSGYDTKPGQIGYWGNGDGRFLYPPRRDPNSASTPCLDGPITSMRWENLRDGIEDYEYFWLLDQEIKRAAATGGKGSLLQEARALLEVPEAVSKDLTRFTTDPRLLLQHRDRIARMIERLRR